MNRQLYIILVAIVLIGGGGYFFWNSRPEQQINRSIDEFLEASRFKKLSLKKQETRHAAFKKIFAESVIFEGESYFPNEELHIERILGELDNFQGMITLCEFTEHQRIMNTSGNEATVTLDLDIKVASGPNFKATQNWIISADVEKQDRWRIIRMTGHPK